MDIRNLIPFGRKKIEVRREEENPLALMQREMNRIFDSFNRTWGTGTFPEATGSFMPRLDVAEDAGSFTVTAELPGMSAKEIELSLSGNTITIRGEKKDEKEEKSGNYYYSERSYGSFMRSIPLPRQVETEKVSASFKKGVLTITLPKADGATDAKKRISVRSE